MVKRFPNMPFWRGDTRIIVKKIIIEFFGDTLSAKDEKEVEARTGAVVHSDELAAARGIMEFGCEIRDGNVDIEVGNLIATLQELGYRPRETPLLVGNL
ncbi:MAG: hypothetical protein AAFO89_02640 [Planctomycetota bacterium]